MVSAMKTLALMAEGVSTLEIKSGYGLTEHDERRCLMVARRLGTELPLQVRTTYLAAHVVPPEYDGSADDYVDALCRWLPGLKEDGLVDAVDAFCEGIGFSNAQTRRVFEAARKLGLPIKLHAEQLSDQGGAALAAEFGALSCDHLEYLSDDGVRAMSAAGTVAVLLPGAFHFLRETKLPPITALRDAGVPIALATDHNPGTSPTLSLLLMMNMACTLFKLTPEEALRGVTVNGARALGLSDRGTLAAGQRADFVVWDVQHPNELAYWFGRNPCRRVIFGGQERGQ
jgi:imidazolonepropionase